MYLFFFFRRNVLFFKLFSSTLSIYLLIYFSFIALKRVRIRVSNVSNGLHSGGLTKCGFVSPPQYLIYLFIYFPNHFYHFHPIGLSDGNKLAFFFLFTLIEFLDEHLAFLMNFLIISTFSGHIDNISPSVLEDALISHADDAACHPMGVCARISIIKLT